MMGILAGTFNVIEAAIKHKVQRVVYLFFGVRLWRCLGDSR